MEEIRGVIIMVEITFEDVEIALKILREFQRKAREVNRVLRKFGVGRSSYRVPRSMEDFMNLVMQTYYPKLQRVREEESKEEEREEGLTEEELKRLREIAEKVRSCLLYTSPSPRDLSTSRMPSSA